ncbi:hypothetical protein [Streptomyces sp. NPDC001594]|uniref:hypothetical protein n=1 Tax=Streptomyces sp. NPDC001594 TaxID=3364590 RepID=UPI0036B8599D
MALCKICYPGVVDFPCERCGSVLEDRAGNRATPAYADGLPRRCHDCGVPHADKVTFFCRRRLHPVVFCRACRDRYGAAVLCPSCGVVLEEDGGGPELVTGAGDGPGDATRSACFCAVCDEGHPEAEVFRCPSADCGGATVCRSCYAAYGGGEVRCCHCRSLLVDSAGAETRHVRPAGHALVGMGDIPSEGRVQEGMQCYAAAAATACNWATGTDLTTDDAMHLFLMSYKAVGEAAGDYRTAYSEAQRMLGYTDAPISEVHAEMRRTPDGESALRAAVRMIGEPEFPEGVAHLYVPRVTSEHLKAAFAAGCTVMVATDHHWLVAYACEVDPAGDVAMVHAYDPGNGSRGIGPWSGAWQDYEGYVVGRSAL